MTMRVFRAALGAALVVGACATDPPGQVPVGTWGAQGAEMQVSNAGADVLFNCASGEIHEPLTLASDGSFSWSGTYTRTFPAPGTPPDSPHAATYSGSATASQVTLVVTVPDISLATSPVVLTHGEDGVMALCP